MVENGETSSALATLPDGSLVSSVVIFELPLARHLYRVTGPNGTVLSEHATLSGLADFLDQHSTDFLEPADLAPNAGSNRTSS